MFYPEQLDGGQAKKVLFKPSSSQLLRNFEQFLNNGKNKKRLIEVIKDLYIEERKKVLSKLECESFYFFYRW